jgi:glycosyltransferase involved in cell wall biosynthesis
MLLSIVVPAYNEEELIGDFLVKLTQGITLDKITYELLIIENGSTDNTLLTARKLAKQNSRIKVFHLAKPSYGLALRFGLQKAKGDCVIVFNVDFWEPRFIKIAAENNLLDAQVVVASKNLPQSKDHRPLMRKLISRGLTVFLHTFLRYKGTDTHGIKIFRKEALQVILPKCKIKSGLFDSELLIRAQRAGFKIVELPVEVREIRPPRFKGRLLDTPKDICELYWALR